MKVLFVCSGNTCRSPMAAALLNHAAQGQDVTGTSAGLATVDGLPATQNAVRVMAERGISIANHASRCFAPSMAAEADLILTMEQAHCDALRQSLPQFAHKIHTLKGYALGKEGSIADPYGQALDVYSACADELEDCILALLERQ